MLNENNVENLEGVEILELDDEDLELVAGGGRALQVQAQEGPRQRWQQVVHDQL